MQTFKDAIRTKWLISFTIVFLLLAINIPVLVLLIGGYLPPNYLSVFLTNLVAVSFPFLPLLALPMGAGVIVDERESGTLEYMMSNPISRFEFILGRLLGMAVATSSVVLLGYGLAAVVAYNADLAGYGEVAITLAVGLALNATMLGIAMTVSTLSKRKATALGTAIFIWFLFTAISNVEYLSIVSTLISGPWVALVFVLLNPIQIAILLVPGLTGIDLSQQGSVGFLMAHLFHASAWVVLSVAFAIWLIFFLALTVLIFTRQDLA
ncbi:MAG: ABC transporter permease [Thaumarchaeota archaeon]|nr:ABC transporter permease [Nitrososphaerota archaeon]